MGRGTPKRVPLRAVARLGAAGDRAGRGMGRSQERGSNRPGAEGSSPAPHMGDRNRLGKGDTLGSLLPGVLEAAGCVVGCPLMRSQSSSSAECYTHSLHTEPPTMCCSTEGKGGKPGTKP